MIGRFDKRHHFHSCEAGLTAALVVEWGDAHQTVGAAFHAHATIRIGGIHLEGGGLDARLFRIGCIHDLGLVAVAFRPTQVHAQQHLCEVGRIHAAGTGANGHHCGTFVVFAVKQGLDFHVSQIVLNAFDFGPRFRQRVGVVFFLSQFHERLDVVDTLDCGGETLQLGLHRGKLAGHLLRVFRVIPQSRFGRLHFKILGLCGQSVDVKRLGNRFVFGACFADCLGKIKFCHRLHHTFLYAFFIFCHGASYGFRTILNFPHAHMLAPTLPNREPVSLRMGMQTRGGSYQTKGVKDLRR